MKKETAIRVIVATAGAIAILFSHPAFAGPDDPRSASQNKSGAQSGPPPPLLDASLSSSYSLRGVAKVGGVNLGDSDASDLGLNVRGSVPIDENWIWPWGVGSQNIFLGPIEGAPIPERINTLTLNTGAGYRFNQRWMINGSIGSTLYRFDDAGGDTFGFSGGVFAMYHANDVLTWNFGMMIAPDSDLKALPVLGGRWLINDQFTLELGIPKTRLSYHVDPKWMFYTGLDMVGTTFRTDKNFGTNIDAPQYNNALATYRDIRLGVGASCEITKGFHAESEVGGSVYRRIDYTRLDQQVEFDPAPYVRFGLSWRF